MSENNIIRFNERMHIPELERKIAEVAELQQKQARAHAQSLADRQLPSSDSGDRLEDYFGSTTSAFNGLMNEADTMIGASVCIAEGKDVIDRAKVEADQTDMRLADLRQERIATQGKRATIPAHDTERRSIIMTQLAVAIISGGEMVFNAFAFSLFTANLIFAILLSFGFWLALHAGAYAIPWLINLASSKKGKVIIATTCTLFIAGLFLWLGTLRLGYAAEAGSTWQDVSAFGFMILNLFLFGTCVFLINHFLPSKEVRKQIRARAKLDATCEKLDTEIKHLEDERRGIEERKKDKLATILKRMSYSKQVESMIQEKYLEVFEVFKQESILRLRRVAPCLRESPKPLKGFAPEFSSPETATAHA